MGRRSLTWLRCPPGRRDFFASSRSGEGSLYPHRQSSVGSLVRTGCRFRVFRPRYPQTLLFAQRIPGGALCGRNYSLVHGLRRGLERAARATGGLFAAFHLFAGQSAYPIGVSGRGLERFLPDAFLIVEFYDLSALFSGRFLKERGFTDDALMAAKKACRTAMEHAGAIVHKQGGAEWSRLEATFNAQSLQWFPVIGTQGEPPGGSPPDRARRRVVYTGSIWGDADVQMGQVAEHHVLLRALEVLLRQPDLECMSTTPPTALRIRMTTSGIAASGLGWRDGANALATAVPFRPTGWAVFSNRHISVWPRSPRFRISTNRLSGPVSGTGPWRPCAPDCRF